MHDIATLEQALKAANARLEAATRALAPKHRGGEWEEYRAAHAAVLILERQRAAAKGEEHAETLDFPVRWDSGAPMPQLLVNDYHALLAFLIHEPDPNWDGSYVTIKSARDNRLERLGLVEFENCRWARLGGANDEVLEGHPLWGKGLEAYSAQRVINSKWLKELETINKVHAQYNPRNWEGLQHYIFWFHDSTFECIAHSFRVETCHESMKSLLGRMVERLVS